eukprot:5375821-Ditylum_brightwellii.AAC.1
MYGYGLVIPLDNLKSLPGAILAPMNIMKQNSIDEIGRIVKKDRLTHDQSYKWSGSKLVNSRVDKDALLLCMFGACIKCIVNLGVAAKKHYSRRCILSTKADYKSAYQ